MQYDYYKILEIPRGASEAQVKRAYRAKAKQFHPDVNNNPKAHEFFLVVSQAYETLIDPNLRPLYDGILDKIYRQESARERPRRRSSAAGFARRPHPVRTPPEVAPKRYRFWMYNFLFLFGMVVGVVIVGIAAFVGWEGRGWQRLAMLVVVPGYILVRDGWRGLTWRGNLLLPRWVRMLQSRRS